MERVTTTFPEFIGSLFEDLLDGEDYEIIEGVDEADEEDKNETKQG